MIEKFCIEGLKKVNKCDIDRIANIATLAFLDDPSSIYLFDKNLNYSTLYEFYTILYKALFEKMSIFVDSDCCAFLIVCSIKNSEVSLFDYIKHGGLKVILRHGLGLVIRSLQYENNNTKIRRKFIDESAWYVMQFGVTPSKQGLGIGSSLMKPFLSWLDNNKLDCYLETLKFKNVDMYRHYGFELKEEYNSPDKKQKQYALLRNSH